MKLSRWAVAVAASTLLTGVLAVAARFDRLPEGLQAEYFPNTVWAPPAARSVIDTELSTEQIISTWHGSPPETFSIRWTGSIIALADATYTLATVSDDGSTVFVDGALVVDNGGRHGVQLAAGSVHLTRGLHPVLIQYFQGGGPFHFEFLWSHVGARLEPVPAWALRPRTVRSLARVAPGLAVRALLAASEWVWAGVLLASAAAAIRPWLARSIRSVALRCAWPELAWLLAASTLLNVIGIWWGLPARWVTIELDPAYVAEALGQRFAHGWFDWYPPFHFGVLAAAMSPLLLFQALGRVSLATSGGFTLALVTCRLVSVAAAAGVVLATCLAGTQVFGKHAGLLAAAIVALTTPFVYYAKTANVDVPYLFWFAWSLVFYLRLNGVQSEPRLLQGSPEGPRMWDYLLLAVCAALAVSTKDQAYALYLLMPVALVQGLWRVNRERGLSRPLSRAILDRRLAAAAAVGVGCFALAQNAVLNPAGFVKHVQLVSGGTAALFRVFDPTLAGRLGLFRLTVRLVQESLAWPFFLASMAGIVLALAGRATRTAAVWLLMPVVSYYFGLINIILYNYDRFVLPVCVVLALFGGLALDRLLGLGFGAKSTTEARPARLRRSGLGKSGPHERRRWGVRGGASPPDLDARRIAAVAILAIAVSYTFLYAATVDVLMVRDSRYVVERWLHAHVGRGESVGVTGLREYLPRVDDLDRVDIGTVDELQRARPAYFVLNADYARAVPPGSPWGALITGLQRGTLGYRLVFRYRRGSPWPWLPAAHPDLAGARGDTTVFSTLRNVDPTIEVFQRGVAP